MAVLLALYGVEDGRMDDVVAVLRCLLIGVAHMMHELADQAFLLVATVHTCHHFFQASRCVKPSVF